jgi:hypothetical protein
MFGGLRPIIDAEICRIRSKSDNPLASAVHEFTQILPIRYRFAAVSFVIFSIPFSNAIKLHCKLCHYILMEEISD